MGLVWTSLTVLFEDPFWIGLYEREQDGHYSVCKITFGAEPKDYEVYAFILNRWKEMSFKVSLETAAREDRHINPKRMQRLIKKQSECTGIGTKAQQALKAQQEQNKLERKVRSRQQREEENRLQYDLKQQKRKEKHRGH